MSASYTLRIAIATSLVVILAVAITVVATPWWDRVTKDTFVAYFANANGLYTGDEVRILGVAVGTVEAIDPQPNRTKVTFSVDREYPVPADARAAILSPSLVSARAIQLVPGVLRRAETRCGRDDSAGPHRGTRRVGRLPAAAGEAHRVAAADDARRGRVRWASSSTALRTTYGATARPRATR